MNIGRYWPQVMIAAECIEVTLPPFKSNITKVCNVIMTLVFTAAVGEKIIKISLFLADFTRQIANPSPQKYILSWALIEIDKCVFLIFVGVIISWIDMIETISSRLYVLCRSKKYNCSENQPEYHKIPISISIYFWKQFLENTQVSNVS